MDNNQSNNNQSNNNQDNEDDVDLMRDLPDDQLERLQQDMSDADEEEE